MAALEVSSASASASFLHHRSDGWRPAQRHGSRIRVCTFQYSACNSKSKKIFFKACYSLQETNTLEKTICDDLDSALVLKNTAEEVSEFLNGNNIFLVGMMGCGKTTVGKIVADSLDYTFLDSDKKIEEMAGGMSVAQIFKDKSEDYFRDIETEVLGQLSLEKQLVIATGGGAVVRKENWNYLSRGVSVWLDVPIEVLASRVVAAGAHSRPLLGQHVTVAGDPYSQALGKLAKLYAQRYHAYASAHARVSLKNIAANEGLDDVSSLTPTAIAVEVLRKVQSYFDVLMV